MEISEQRKKELNNLLNKLQDSYLEGVNSVKEDRQRRIPLKNKRDIIALIHNIFVSNHYKKGLSYNDYEYIISSLIDQIDHNNIESEGE